jgi:hypothetical protein
VPRRGPRPHPLLGEDPFVAAQRQRAAERGATAGGPEPLTAEERARLAAAHERFASKRPEVPPEVPEDLQGLTPEQQLAARRHGMKTVYGQEAAARSVEKGERTLSYDEAYDNAISQGYDESTAQRIAMGQLQGEYARAHYGGLLHLTEEDIARLIGQVHEHADLRTFERVTASRAIRNVAGGKVPRPHEMKLLEKVFGMEKAKGLAKQAEEAWYKRWGWDLLNLPRTIQSSMDLSAPLRQGLVAGARHPIIWAKAWGPMMRSLKSKGSYDAVMEEIYRRESFELMDKHGLALTDLGHLTGREEAYASTIGDKIPGVSHSARAYTGFLNRLRADMWDALYQDALSSAKAAGRSEDEALDDLAKFINSATGRGNLSKHVAPAAGALNALLFSPRLLASRLSFLNPLWYARLDPFARKQALRSAIHTLGIGMTALGALSMVPGVTVGFDPRSANFGKIKIGNTRIDPWGGFQPVVRYLAQLVTGTYVSSTTGKAMPLGGGKFGATTRADIILRFIRSKTSPNISLLWDWLADENIVGEEFEAKREMGEAFLPLLSGDMLDLWREHQNIPAVVGASVLGGVGVGVQTYGPRKKKGRRGGTGSLLGPPSGSSGGLFGGSDGSSGLFGP